MYRIRSYGDSYHPDLFKRSGWSGFWIITLNWLRWKLEVYVQGLVIRHVSKALPITESKTAQLMRTFRIDVKAEQVEKERTSPLNPEPEVVAPPVTRAERYDEATFVSSLEPAVSEKTAFLPERPLPLDELIGRYAPNVRAKRYARGHRWKFADPEGEFVSMADKPDAQLALKLLEKRK